MDSKRNDSDGEIQSGTKSPHDINPSSWSEVKTKYLTNTVGNSRKRKFVTESEMSANGDLASKSTRLIVKRENNSSICDDNQTSGLFGLKQQFIESLGIKPPLAKWVYVTNFRCDKVELREVLELAGHVVSCAVVKNSKKFANVMYSHPLEAVQAVSMFNGQILYGMKMKVTMINPPSDIVILPKGLKDVGPGLGFNGRPLRDIVKHFKKYTKHQNSLVDASLFSRTNDDNDDEIDVDPRSVSSQNSGEDSDASKRRKYFKTTNVEDLRVTESSQDSSVSENQSKKARLENNDNEKPKVGLENQNDDSSSDEERIDDVRIVSNFKTKESGSSEKKTVSRDPRTGGSSTQTVGGKPEPASSVYNPLVQSTQAPILQATGSRPIHPQDNAGSVRMDPPGPFGSFGPPGPIRPVGPIGPSGPMGPIGSSGPVTPFHPVPVRQDGPMIPPVGPNGPMMGPGGPGPVRPNGPLGPFGPPGPVGPAIRGPSAPFFSPPGPNVPPIVQGQNPASGPHPMFQGSGPTPPGPSQPMANDVITLMFRNLPPSTTFPLLCDKVSQCGQVLSLQLTTPGCAVARFAHRAHAERCFQFFNGKCIDGCFIEVRFA